jgi:hypothetical protein
LKIEQLKRLNWAMVLLYIGILLFLFSGILGAITDPSGFAVQASMIIGVLVSLAALAYLISFGFRSVIIREKHLQI